MALWGWIPNLTEGRTPSKLSEDMRKETGLSDRGNLGIEIITSESDDSFDIVITKLGSNRIRVKTVSGFFVVSEYINEIKNIRGLTDLIYSRLKSLYHLDVTHSPYGGLGFVEADTLEEAVRKTGLLFVSWTSRMDAERLYGNLPSVDEYMGRHGFISYGLAFVEEYENELGNEATSMKEILVSLDSFYGINYEFHRNEHMERLTKSSKELAERSTRLNEDVMILTKLVIFLTIASIVIAIADLALSHFESISIVTTGVSIVILLLIVAILLHHWGKSGEDEHKSDNDTSTDNAMTLKSLVVVVGVLITIVVSILILCLSDYDVADVTVISVLCVALLLSYGFGDGLFKIQNNHS